MNRACEKQRKLNENKNKNDIYTQNPNESAENSAPHNVE